MPSSSSFEEKSKKQSSFNLFAGWKNKEKKVKNEQEEDEEEEKDVWEDILQDNNSEEEEVEQEVEEEEEKEDRTKMKKEWWSGWADSVLKKVTGVSNQDKEADERDGGISSVEALVKKARSFHASNDDSQKEARVQDDIEKLQQEIKMVFQQVSDSFGDHDLDNMKLLNPISFNYFLEKDESVKTPSWKRRKHRFLDEVETEIVYGLHDALYLAEASYLDSVDDITAALKDYDGAPYELVYCNTEAEPRQPAHYIAIQKVPTKSKKSGLFSWDKKTDKNSVLEILMVVRGTKDFSDMLSDCLLEYKEYGDEGGVAHDGVCQSGLFLAEKHTEFFEHLLKESGRKSIRLSLVGHSLGAGAASIACIEFNKHDKIDATCIGFGCPALLSLDLSKAWREKITTVICDSDCVPRMSKATVSNLILDVMSNNWTDNALTDVSELLNVVKENSLIEIPSDKIQEALEWVKDYLQTQFKPEMDKVSQERSVVQLFPPRKCIHMFRDGLGVSLRYTPCDFFNEFDVCFTMVDDHLVSTGYNRLFYDYVRNKTKNSRFFFRNNVNMLRLEKHLAEETANDDESESE